MLVFYHVRFIEGKRKKYAEVVPLEKWPEETIFCAKCGKTWRKNLYNVYGTELKLALSNENYADFLWFHIPLVSEKTRTVLESENVSGCSFERIKIVSVNEMTEFQKKEWRNYSGSIKRFAVNPPTYNKLFVDLGAYPHQKVDISVEEYCEEWRI
jgi:hypothetical protein